MLLIIDNDVNIREYFTCENEFINAGDWTLIETLEKVGCFSNIKKIYFPLELKFKNKKRQDFEGLELLKHIRLTPELGDNLRFAPILLGYTYPLETVLRNPESTILCSPATHLFHLKNIHLVNNSSFFQSKELLTKDNLKPYILYTDTDEAKSEHDRRNEQGPLKLERELKGEIGSDIGLDLWQKKILFLQPAIKANEKSKISENEFKNAIKGKRVLYLDDEADKWENQLKKLFEEAHITTYSKFPEIQNLCKYITEKRQEILKEFKKEDAEVAELMPMLEGLRLKLKIKQSEEKRLKNELDTKQKEIESSKAKTLITVEETQRLLKMHYESMAESLISDYDKIENLDDTIIQNFIQVSGKLKLVKDCRDALQKLCEYKLTIESNIKEIHDEISTIQDEMNNKKKTDLKFYNKYISELERIIPYDLIILDLRLNPNIDRNNSNPTGINILNSIKQFNPHIPVLLFTSSQNPEILKLAKKLNVDAYWVKNVSHVNDLKQSILNISVDTTVNEIYWKSELIIYKTIIEKYYVSEYGKTIEKKTLNTEDRNVLINSLKYFIHFLKSKSLSDTDFWTNTGKLSEARFVSAKNKQGHPEQDRPKLIEHLKLNSIERDFNFKRNKSGAHIGHAKEDNDLCKKYINHSIDWFLNYLPYKE